MAVSPSVQEFLRRSEIEYTVFPHPPAYTARQEAIAASVPARNWAKTVICFADGEPIEAVVPSDCEVDLELLREVAGASYLRLATEDELDWMFPECETGAMPPLGPLYRQLVFVDERLAEDKEIVFNGGSFANAIAMRYADYSEIVRPIVGRFARVTMR